MAPGTTRAALGAFAAGALIGFGPAAAHHSIDPFDTATERVVAGEVVEFEWANPHTRTRIDVANPDGTLTRWDLEGMSPAYLGRRGWSRHTLAPGDWAEVVIHPLKSGEPGGLFIRATLEDGTVKAMFASRDETSGCAETPASAETARAEIPDRAETPDPTERRTE